MLEQGGSYWQPLLCLGLDATCQTINARASRRCEYHELLAGALNFRDVMLAYGKLSRNQMAHDSGGDNIGFEFSGTVASLFTGSLSAQSTAAVLGSLLSRLFIVAVNKACGLPLRDTFLTNGGGAHWAAGSGL